MITVEKWSGLVTNASPYSLPGGAFAIQTNLQCTKPGQIQSRPGLTSVTQSVSAGVMVSAVRLAGGTTERVLVQVGPNLLVLTVP